MTGPERSALAALKFSYTQVPDDVWRSPQFHVEGLHRHTAHVLLGGLAEARESPDVSPVGVIVQGQRGAGKTHLLGWVREKVQRESGYFFLVSLLDAKGFWESIVVSMLDSLSRERVDGKSQLSILLEHLSLLADVPRMVRRAVTGNSVLSKTALDTFIDALRRFNKLVGRDSQDTARALVLLASDDLRAQDIGESFLSSTPEEEPGERAQWGIRQVQKTPQEIVRNLSHLLALTGPSIIAIDQIDTLVAQSSMSTGGDAVPDTRETIMIEQVAGGLMSLREVTRRTLTVVSCLPMTWILIERFATDTVRDRFRKAVQLKTIPDAETGRALIEKRFESRFREIGFEPPYSTWPVSPSAFDLAPDFTPRQLLIKIDEHIQSCLLNGEIKELEHLGGRVPAKPGGTTPPPVASEEDLSALDARFAELRNTAKVVAALSPATEDAAMPPLLSAGLTAWITEQGEAGQAFDQDPPPSSKPPLHARLRRSLDESTEDEAHWGFRAISSENAISALNRLRKASVAAGLDLDVPKRRLFVLRNANWAKGPRTLEAVAAFEHAGGRILGVDPEDLKILSALRDLLRENPPHLRAWLAVRRPTGDVKLLGEALGDVWTVPGEQPAHPARAEQPGPIPSGGQPDRPTPRERSGRITPGARLDGVVFPARVSPDESPGQAAPAVKPPSTVTATRPDARRVPYIALGTAVNGDAPVGVELEALRKHTAIFAGSGSGKTVLIRNLIERCALQGVSAIVLDPNNDLARMGDPWPEAPEQWASGDAARAAEYLTYTDVVVWTPGLTLGRPLSFQPLPDFASVLDDADEFNEAIEVAVASIVPKAKLGANTHKAQLGQAVLRETLKYYARRGGPTSLAGLIEMLSALPEGVSGLANAERLAADLGQILAAAVVNDPMFGGVGAPVDPGLLLTPPPDKTARVSVINLAGLQSDDQRQSFVNQLQMALFAWIKKHPAGDRPLGGLFVMDEAQTFAPSGAMTACTKSTLALASQARKYGLGLVFATQAPKGLHNRIPGNAATQFFGLLNSPAQIDAAREMARGKGSRVTDISKLRSGQFYTAVEGMPFVKVQVPMCLSHHPKDPLTVEEVVKRAKNSL
ncbi:ATP-binding protein [Streptosporangium lutulentum]|uniref:AAA+ ATPase domain-containing protein n=1 Tax=Streptosporangium lutulentum TaxID=1461250 RepID=A0ABT9QPJ4_9ACTN|nr:ATP-binding protein [Streptosporangium lutulentum]MDP9848286.1 hypothetical protein [Streptosporangium lutulentum]